MKAQQLLDTASFGPEALKTIIQAFDEAWASIAANFGNDAATIEAARSKLADVVLSVASEQSRNVQELKKEVLEAMARIQRRPN